VDLRPPMSYRNRFAQLTTEAAENAARLVLSQLSERLNFPKHRSNNRWRNGVFAIWHLFLPSSNTKSKFL